MRPGLRQDRRRTRIVKHVTRRYDLASSRAKLPHACFFRNPPRQRSGGAVLAGGCGLLQTQKEGSQCRLFSLSRLALEYRAPFYFLAVAASNRRARSESARETSADGRRVGQQVPPHTPCRASIDPSTVDRPPRAGSSSSRRVLPPVSARRRGFGPRREGAKVRSQSQRSRRAGRQGVRVARLPWWPCPDSAMCGSAARGRLVGARSSLSPAAGGQRRPPCLDTSPLPSSLRRAMQSVTEHLPQIRPRHGEQRGVGRKMWRGGVVG